MLSMVALSRCSVKTQEIPKILQHPFLFRHPQPWIFTTTSTSLQKIVPRAVLLCLLSSSQLDSEIEVSAGGGEALTWLAGLTPRCPAPKYILMTSGKHPTDRYPAPNYILMGSGEHPTDGHAAFSTLHQHDNCFACEGGRT